MNPKNILKLLHESFNKPQYEVETVITNKEKNFALQLEELIKNAVDNHTFLETYTTLHFGDENVEPIAIEGEEGYEYKPTEYLKKNLKLRLILNIKSC